MQLRRFKGKALPEVVAQVRAELGPDAVILHTKEGRGFSRFLHGPTLLIEYDNTQNSANHIHSVWHDPVNDFGADLLRAHYERGHHHG